MVEDVRGPDAGLQDAKDEAPEAVMLLHEIDHRANPSDEKYEAERAGICFVDNFRWFCHGFLLLIIVAEIVNPDSNQYAYDNKNCG